MLKDLSIARLRQTNLHSMQFTIAIGIGSSLPLSLSPSSLLFTQLFAQFLTHSRPRLRSVNYTVMWRGTQSPTKCNWTKKQKSKRPNLQTNELDDNFVALCTMNVIGTKCPPNFTYTFEFMNHESNLIFVRAHRLHDVRQSINFSLCGRRDAQRNTSIDTMASLFHSHSPRSRLVYKRNSIENSFLFY